MKLTFVLETVAWAEEHFGACLTNRQLPRRDMERALNKGLVRSIGLTVVCDDDGFTIEPEQYREGFVLTAEGRAALARRRPRPE